MHSFDLYPQAWALYIVLGLGLLYMIDLKLRKRGFVTRTAVLSLIAVGAFTPSSVNDTGSQAPLVLNMLFKAEVEGLAPLYEGLTTLVIIWGILLALAFSIRHFYGATKDQVSTEKHSDDEKTERSA